MSIATRESDNTTRLREVRAILRSDLQISRQLYQGEPAYVIHDPVRFSSHRLPLETYRVLTALGPGRTLGAVFDALVAEGVFTLSEEDEFYDLITTLYHSRLIVLPFHDGKKLFQAYEKLTAAARKHRLVGFIFFQVPLANPDAFLTKTAPKLRWLFTKAFFVIWAIAAVAALTIVAKRASDFAEPFNGILALQNLPFLWLSFIGLKVWHEFGHGYACKVFGGAVPEMGTILIAGNPLAYVDATSAWSFPERRKRLIVMFGGMYFESLLAIPAVFIWAFTTNPLLQSFAFNIIITATLVTLLFNLNPLMKFDGYFILSELLGIQNLRGRSEHQLKSYLKRAFLGIKSETLQGSARLRTMFVSYSIASAIYRAGLILRISLMVAERFFLLGVAMAAFYIVTSVVAIGRKLWAYLMHDPETEHIRARCRAIAFGLAVGIPAILTLVPVPFGVVTDGVIGFETEYFVRVDTPGEFVGPSIPAGQTITAGSELVVLSNPMTELNHAVARNRLVEAEVAWQVAREEGIVESARLETQVHQLQKETANAELSVERLRLVSPGNGQLVRNLDQTSRGSFLRRGSAVAVVVNGKPVLRTWLNEEQLKTVVSEPGTQVEARVAGRDMHTFRGEIIAVEQAAQTVFEETALTPAAGGTIVVDPRTKKPVEPLFKVEIAALTDSIRFDDHGSRISLRFQRAPESIARWTVRNCLRFLHRLRLA